MFTFEEQERRFSDIKHTVDSQRSNCEASSHDLSNTSATNNAAFDKQNYFLLRNQSSLGYFENKSFLQGHIFFLLWTKKKHSLVKISSEQRSRNDTFVQADIFNIHFQLTNIAQHYLEMKGVRFRHAFILKPTWSEGHLNETQ